MKGLSKKGWDIAVDVVEFAEAVKFATRKGGYAKVGRTVDNSLEISATDNGICVASANLAMDVPAIGTWQGTIRVFGPTLAALAPKLSGPTARIRFAKDELTLNTTSIAASAI